MFALDALQESVKTLFLCVFFFFFEWKMEKEKEKEKERERESLRVVGTLDFCNGVCISF